MKMHGAGHINLKPRCSIVFETSAQFSNPALRGPFQVLTIDGAPYWSQHIQRPGKGSIPGAVSIALRTTQRNPVRCRGRFKQREVQALQVTFITLTTGVRKRFEVSLCADDATRVVIVVVILAMDRWLWMRWGCGIWV
jgi:hypothetical protein